MKALHACKRLADKLIREGLKEYTQKMIEEFKKTWLTAGSSVLNWARLAKARHRSLWTSFTILLPLCRNTPKLACPVFGANHNPQVPA